MINCIYKLEMNIFFFQNSMLWKHTKVTAKRLHRDVEAGSEVDQLIKEADYMGYKHGFLT